MVVGQVAEGGLMERYFFTFGFGSEDKDKYFVIDAIDYIEARRIMFERFGTKWAFQYSEQEFDGQAEKYDLTELK